MYKEYLGDGIYVQLSDFGDVELTTENGLEETNRIILELGSLKKLDRWVNRVKVELDAIIERESKGGKL